MSQAGQEDRQARLLAIQQQIQAGTFRVDLAQLAEVLLDVL
jgi:anti-sigma28 factor (negative regulator of flagellin synthesis)